ncbi:hypothetical protein [Aliarcobacter lanthieri]|uniref:hypothetical protein n=1 Tax=Aliarcobacter lanthieri TaxID=1355374 RepID=UPI00047ED7FA|nr:hypothetical protein [Aliarcobacter lanthieri]QKF59039.1 hypothetical protein ALANTH_0925 [Aliarcobacter lanthieri]
MPSYKKYLIAFFIIGFLASCSLKEQSIVEKDDKQRDFTKVESKPFELEDYYIMYALEMENIRMYEAAKDIYLKLFENTNKYEYLVQHITIATQFQDYEAVKQSIEKYFIPNIKEEEILIRLYSFSLLKLEDFDKALENALKLTNLYKNSINYELLGAVYASKGEFEQSYLTLQKALKYQVSDTIMQTITNLEFFNLEKKEEAIKSLKAYLPKSDYNFNLSLQLLAFYDTLGQKEEIKNLLKDMFLYYKHSEDEMQLNKTIRFMFQNFEFEELILFLEQNSIEDDLLLELYKRTNQPKKAYSLLNKLYQHSSNSEYLGQQAIIEFELSEDKKNSLKSVIEKFNMTLETSTNPIYQNYLAYLLIDYDIDVKKGLVLVKKALEQDPTNIAFIDTLAWGEYKNKNCKEAFKNMKRIVDEIGLEDEEIKLHWEKIKECK